MPTFPETAPPEVLTFEDSLSMVVTSPPAPSPAVPGGTGRPSTFPETAGSDCNAADLPATVCTRTVRTIPTALGSHLAGESLTLAYCLRLALADGTVMGFTSCDKDLTFDGGSGSATYEALNSITLTALRQELGARVGDTDLTGLLRSDRVTAGDLLAGRYDGAEITLYLVNWADLTQGSATLARGYLGTVTVVDNSFRVQFRSLAQRWQQQIVELTSPACRVKQLGDSRCKVPLSLFQSSAAVTSVTDPRTISFGGDGSLAGFYGGGRVIFTSGLNAGIAREIKSHQTGGALQLQEGFPYAVAIGDVATLEAGCDRQFRTCRVKFNNVVNFRGEPHVPGETALKRVATLIKRLGNG